MISILYNVYANVKIYLITVTDIKDADFYIYYMTATNFSLTECNNEYSSSKLIILDEGDSGGGLMLAIPYFMYFKRSFVRKTDGHIKKDPAAIYPLYIDTRMFGDIYPMTYSIANSYIHENYNRTLENKIMCTLRTGMASMTTRVRTQNWVYEYGVRNNMLDEMIVNEVCLSLITMINNTRS